MSKAARFGPVQVEFRDDGSLFVYQPDPSMVLGETRARDLIAWLFDHAATAERERAPFTDEEREAAIADGHLPYPFTAAEVEREAAQPTVPAGVVNTSAGPIAFPDHAPFTDEELASHDKSVAELDAHTEESIRRGVADVEAKNVTRRDDVLDDTISDGVGGRVSEPKAAPKRRPGRPRKQS